MGRVLLVEDENIVRNATLSMLHELGYDSDSCASFPQAVELLRSSIYQSRKYKVAIIDLVIGESASGTDLFRTLLELDPDLKGILSTGYIEDPVVENYEKYGFSTVLLKPYQIKDLAKVMESVLMYPDPPEKF